ncbi:23S ribosomal RNA methyltransferase, partial [Hortaea werneckii]
SSASSSRWKTRQSNDSYAREAKVAGLKSRAAFKLLEINDKYRLFRPGDTVVDLGYAPGSWSQVALNRTQPGGRVVGIDIIPAQPPRGVSTLQGDFLSVEIREELRRFVVEGQGRPRRIEEMVRREGEGGEEGEGWTEEELDREGRGVVELERASSQREGDARQDMPSEGRRTDKKPSQRQADEAEGRVVNVVLSDMCEPWPLVTSSWIKSDLCHAALTFAFDTLSAGGNFLCKFYQGEEDKALELRLKKLFDKTYRIKPDSSRKESKEAYLVGLRRKGGAVRNEVLGGG